MKFNEANVTIIMIVAFVSVVFGVALWATIVQSNQLEAATNKYLEICVQDGYKESDCMIKWLEANRSKTVVNENKCII